jgi:hypothetical protein
MTAQLPDKITSEKRVLSVSIRRIRLVAAVQLKYAVCPIP